MRPVGQNLEDPKPARTSGSTIELTQRKKSLSSIDAVRIEALLIADFAAMADTLSLPYR
jgi:hypothetical protein